MISAFVLKCPECGAPQPTTSPTCAYCGVPLMWAPSKSLSRDDDRDLEIEDEPNTELVSFSAEVAAGATWRFTYHPQKPERLRFIWVAPSCAESFVVGSFRNGVMSPLGNTRAPSLVFSRGRGFPFASNADMLTGILFSFEATNETVYVRRFDAVLRVGVLGDEALGFTREGRTVRGIGGRNLPPGVSTPTWLNGAWRR